MGGKCVKNNAPVAPCIIPATGTAAAVMPPHLEGCNKCYDAGVAPATDLVCGECDSDYSYEAHTGTCRKNGQDQWI
jgi:hypothetical protein